MYLWYFFFFFCNLLVFPNEAFTWSVWLLWLNLTSVTIHPLAGPHYLNLLNQVMAIWLSSGFSHLQPGAFYIALQTHKTQHRQPRGWKKRRTNKHGLGLAPSTRREKFGHFSVVFCASVGYHECVSKQNSHTATRNTDSSSHIGQPGLWVHRS